MELLRSGSMLSLSGLFEIRIFRQTSLALSSVTAVIAFEGLGKSELKLACSMTHNINIVKHIDTRSRFFLNLSFHKVFFSFLEIYWIYSENATTVRMLWAFSCCLVNEKNRTIPSSNKSNEVLIMNHVSNRSHI